MSAVIHMTALQAAAVTDSAPRPTKPQTQLIPVALNDGTFIVGAQVMADPAFSDRRVVLQAVAQVDYSVVSALAPQMVVASSVVVSGQLDTP